MKLSTDKIRALLTLWICTDEVKERMKFNYFSPDADNQELDFWRTECKLKSTATPEEIDAALWKQWCNVKQWKRTDKRTLSDDEWKYFLFKPTEDDPTYSFISDHIADYHNKELVEYYYSNPTLADKLVYRMLIPNNAHGDNMRIEIVTTHDDKDVVGWCITSD